MARTLLGVPRPVRPGPGVGTEDQCRMNEQQERELLKSLASIATDLGCLSIAVMLGVIVLFFKACAR